MGAPQLKKEDVLTSTSDIPGLKGWMEAFLRRFRTVSFVFFLLPLVAAGSLCVGLSAAPGLFVFHWFTVKTQSWPEILHYAAMGWGLSLGYMTYGITLIFVAPAMNFLIPLRVKPFRGPWFSLPAIPWYVHNAFTYIVRYTFLELVTPSPLNILFYRMMGMKIGKGVVINSTNISDPALITLGDYVTIGGSATVFAHYGQKGYLVIAPVTIGQKTNVGLKASIMGGSEIGENVTIKPHVAILPKTKIADGETV